MLLWASIPNPLVGAAKCLSHSHSQTELALKSGVSYFSRHHNGFKSEKLSKCFLISVLQFCALHLEFQWMVKWNAFESNSICSLSHLPRGVIDTPQLGYPIWISLLWKCQFLWVTISFNEFSAVSKCQFLESHQYLTQPASESESDAFLQSGIQLQSSIRKISVFLES